MTLIFALSLEIKSVIKNFFLKSEIYIFLSFRMINAAITAGLSASIIIIKKSYNLFTIYPRKFQAEIKCAAIDYSSFIIFSHAK